MVLEWKWHVYEVKGLFFFLYLDIQKTKTKYAKSIQFRYMANHYLPVMCNVSISFKYSYTLQSEAVSFSLSESHSLPLERMNVTNHSWAAWDTANERIHRKGIPPQGSQVVMGKRNLAASLSRGHSSFHWALALIYELVTYGSDFRRSDHFRDNCLGVDDWIILFCSGWSMGIHIHMIYSSHKNGLANTPECLITSRLKRISAVSGAAFPFSGSQRIFRGILYNCVYLV